MNDAAALAHDAAWLAHRLVDDGRGLRFVRADRAAQRAATFLDDSYLGDALPRVDARALDIARAGPAAPAPLHFIFHSAFACSTLLARAMDLPTRAMGLKEPVILNDATQLLRKGLLGRDTLDLVLRLLERPLAAGETIVVKPSNAANPLMVELLRLRPRARAILLYRDLPAYLRSIARKGMFGRIWARRQLAAIGNEAPFDTGFSAEDLFIQTDLQAAAFGWLIQHAQFAALARAMPDRVRLLEAAELLADRHAAIAAVSGWFGLGLDPGTVATVVDGPAFAEDAKRVGQRFGTEPDEQPSPVDEDELRMVTEWTGAVAAHAGVPMRFGPRLVPSAATPG